MYPKKSLKISFISDFYGSESLKMLVGFKRSDMIQIFRMFLTLRITPVLTELRMLPGEAGFTDPGTGTEHWLSVN